MRRQVWHTCLTCATTFQGLATARYCCEACRQRAKYQRKLAKAAKRAAARAARKAKLASQSPS
jgi:hypothetical protein